MHPTKDEVLATAGDMLVGLLDAGLQLSKISPTLFAARPVDHMPARHAQHVHADVEVTSLGGVRVRLVDEHFPIESQTLMLSQADSSISVPTVVAWVNAQFVAATKRYAAAAVAPVTSLAKHRKDRA